MILTSIRNFIKNQKLFFAIFIILQILAVISAQYSYLDNIQKENDWIIYVEEATIFKVEFSEDIKISQLNSHIQKIQNNYRNKISSISIDIDDGNLRAYYFGQNKVINYGKTEIFANDIIISTNTNISNGKQLGDVFETSAKKFNVTSLRTNAPYNEILLESVNDDFNINSLNITLSFLPKISQRMAFTEYLQELFPNGNVIEPNHRSSSTEAKFSSELTSSICLLLLTIVNIIFMFRYIILKRKKSYIIARLCGATKKQIFITTLTEYFIYCLTSCLFATFITKIVIMPIFYDEVFFSLDALLLPACAFMMMCICTILPLLVQNSKLHMIQNKVVK